MKKSTFKNKPRKPLKRSGFKSKGIKPPKPKKQRTTGRIGGNKPELAGHQTAKQLKKEIQATLRELVMLRDKKCVLHGIIDNGRMKCNHEIGVNDEGVVWQAEHLIERSNSATYADPRLVVLVCKNCHGWKHFKKSNHDQYDKWVKTKISPERVALWERCENEMWRVNKVDWKLELLALKQEVLRLSTS
jgi:hypothetical protein